MKSKLAILCLIILFVEAIVYFYADIAPLGSDTNLISRRIDTLFRLFANGYLGLLFNFMALGNINWLILLLLPLYLKSNKLTTWHKPFVFFTLIAGLLVSIQGYFNDRYLLTLLPFFLIGLIYIIYELIEKEVLPKFTWYILLGMVVFNFGWYVKANFITKYEKKMHALSTQFRNEPATEKKDCNEFINQMNIASDAYFLVNNVPEFYYYTNKKGYYYLSTDNLIRLSNGAFPLFSPNENSLTSSRQKLDSLNCRYIYTTQQFIKMDKTLSYFIDNNCNLLFQDSEDRRIYEIKKIAL